MTTLRPPTFDPADAAAAARRFAASAEPDIAYDVVDGPVGPLVVAVTPRGLLQVSYEEFRGGLDEILGGLAAKVSPRILERRDVVEPVRRELDEYFARRRTRFDVPLDWTLTTPFQRDVLRATAAIPFGETRSYGQIAAQIGRPGASRATGTALGRNPIPVIVPCHRILRGGGVLGSYTGGVERKRLLLDLEGVTTAND